MTTAIINSINVKPAIRCIIDFSILVPGIGSALARLESSRASADPIPGTSMEKSMMQRIAGFTLIELMMAVVIVAILSTLALPSYTRYLQRGDLVEGTQALSQYRVQMEQWYQDNNTYADAAGAACGVNPPGNPPQVNFQVTCT